MSNNPPLYQCGNCVHCGSRWHLKDYCPFKEAPAFKPLAITKDGEALGPYPKCDMEPARIIGHCFATHFVCNGFVDLWPVSGDKNAIVCRQCKLRVVVPNTLETWGDLLNHFRNILL